LLDPTPLIAEGARWLQGVLAARRSQKVNAAANVLYEAGTVVVLLRTQREQLERALGPLRDFRPKDWPDSMRAEAIANIRTVIHDPGRWYQVMNMHVGTLRGLSAEPKDKVKTLCDVITESAVNVTHLGYEIYDMPVEQGARPFMQNYKSYREKGLEARSSWVADVDPNADLVGPDALISDSLPALFWLIECAQSEQETDDLRRLAAILLTTRSRREDEDIDRVVSAATYAYGELGAVLRTEYPELPVPSWVDLPL
jgi:hypothetical protein